MGIQITDTALEYLKNKLEKQSGKGILMTLEKRGCSGYAYALSVVEDEPSETLKETISGMHIFLDPLWAHFFNELTIDLEVDLKSGLKQKKLVFLHPKEKNRCGCGESFQVE